MFRSSADKSAQKVPEPVETVDQFTKKVVETPDQFTKKTVETVDQFTKKAVETADPFMKKTVETSDQFTKKAVETADQFTKKTVETADQLTKKAIETDTFVKKTSDFVESFTKKPTEYTDTSYGKNLPEFPETFTKKIVEYGDDFRTLEDCLKNVPPQDLKDLKIHLYGRPDDHEVEVSKQAQKISKDNDFVVKHYKFEAAMEHTRPPKMVKVACIQHAVSAPLTDPINVQKRKTFEKVGKIIDAAGAEGVNVLCLQELWYLPYFFCTREKKPWCEFAENAETGEAVTFLRAYAKKYDMVIVSPILERDETHGDNIWNTAVVISNTGKVMGKSRKNHIPRENDFNESTYYYEGNTGHRVFETKYGKIAIVICFGRHQPQNWMMYALNGADIIFNPSAELCGNLSDKNWFIEGRANAVANSVYTVTINRVGTEIYPNEFTSGDGKKAHKHMGPHYGSSYLATPEGERCPGLPRDKDGLLVCDVDLNMCRQAKDLHTYTMCRRLPLYAEAFAKVALLDYEPDVIKET